uniref:Astacin domain-containing protein n=1 Tax=Angiostrongylus cantonensis TaxID=6313 RepID=A0A0K0DLA5_ANGCA
MRVLLLAYFVALASSEKSFEEKLKEGNQLLKNEPNAGDTMEFLAKLHTMEDEIKDEYTASTKPNADVLKAMKNYADIKKAHIRPMGDTIEEVNKKSRVDTALFQGDIILTKQQAEEIMEDINHKEGNRRKRQAYVDEKYPGTIWSNGVTFTFWNASAAARKVFKKAVSLWAWETCINFGESFADMDNKRGPSTRIIGSDEDEDVETLVENKYLYQPRVSSSN